MKYRLKKDIVIKKGTIMGCAPRKTRRYLNGHYDCIIGLSDNTSGTFEYFIDDDKGLEEYFEAIK